MPEPSLDTALKQLHQATALQDELAPLTEKLAEEIAVLPSMRDGAAIRRLWQIIDDYRPRLNTLYRNLRKYTPGSRKDMAHKEYSRQKYFLHNFKILRQRLQFWNTMASLVERHADPVAEPLVVRRDASGNDPILSLVYYAFHRLANPHPQDNDAKDHGCFPDIAMDIQSFEALMKAAYRLLLIQGRTLNARFLDVGCGGGTKVFAATRFFKYCDGLEYDARYVDAARNMLDFIRARDCTIHHGDGITYSDYDKYDVIYFYRPVNGDDRLAEMERQILTTARPGTVVLAPYDSMLLPRNGIVGAKITNPVFIAGISQSEADALRAEAERTSTEIIRHSADYSFDAGFWAPILDAATFNGETDFRPDEQDEADAYPRYVS